MFAIRDVSDSRLKNRSLAAEHTPPSVRLVVANGLAKGQGGGSNGKLLDRETQFEALAIALNEAATGTGRIALVHGEAGIGKSVLVESFVAANRPKARALIGRCDALLTPQPLSPLHEIALEAKGPLLSLIQSPGGQHAIFAALLSELQGANGPTVVVFEDVHWADAATLDLLKYVGRRTRNLSVLLILTYRDDEIDRTHSLWSVLGHLPADVVRRVALKPLTEAAVGQLAKEAGRPAGGVHDQTGGNPFYVTELLAGPSGVIPASVREATLARATRLSSDARALLDLCAVVPNRIERRLAAEEMCASRLIEECISTGLLIDEGEFLRFRHELARQAVVTALPLSHLRELHRIVLRRLLEGDMEVVAVPRLVHHAAGAADAAAVRLYAPQAARQASALGAHREAAAHYWTALDYARAADVEMHATLLEAYAYECFLTDQLDHAITARNTALELRRRQGNLLKAGDNLRWLSRLAWFRGRGEDARRLASQAIEVLERAPAGPELAMAYSSLAQLNMLSEDCKEAVEWGDRALQLAERLSLTEVLVHALNNVGHAEFLMGKGCEKLERSLELALDHEMHEHASRAYTNLIFQALIIRDYPSFAARLADGLAYARAREFDSGTPYMVAMRARAYLEQGLWQDAEHDAKDVLRAGETVARLIASVVLGCVRIRRGDCDAQPLLDEARERALAAGEIHRIGPMAAACAEHAWLKGDKAQMREELRYAHELALKHPEPWRLGELSLWLWRAGGLDHPPEGIAEPYRLEMSGDWRSAAGAWERIGCPYEQALALASGDQLGQLQALEILTRLGAAPAAQMVRRNLHAAGLRGVPRGPSSETRCNPLGLTSRQLDILRLLAGNLSNKQIAAKLGISPRTVDHHVFAILGRLGVSNRREAATHAATRPLLEI